MSNFNSAENPYNAPENPYSAPAGGNVPIKDPLERVKGPAVGIVVTSVIGIILAVLNLVMNLVGVGVGAAGAAGAIDGMGDTSELASLMGQGLLGVVQSIAGMLVGVVCLLGGNKMRKLEAYNFSMISTVLIMVPCLSPCCILGLPFGIWGLIVLNDAAVKSAFTS